MPVSILNLHIHKLSTSTVLNGRVVREIALKNIKIVLYAFQFNVIVPMCMINTININYNKRKVKHLSPKNIFFS